MLAMLAGATTAPVVGAVSASIAVRVRTFIFTRQKQDPPPLPDWLPVFPTGLRADGEEKRDNSMREELKLVHARANVQQDRSFGQLIATSMVLLTAFIITTFGVTVAHSSAWLHFYSAALDIVALTIAFFAYRRSGANRAEWLRQRAVAELLRQWLTVEYLLAPMESAITARIAGLVSRFERAISGNADKLIEEVSAIGRARLEEIATALGPLELSRDALGTYYVARPLRQVDWFQTSLARIEKSHHRRARLIGATFFGAILAACAKLAALLSHLEGLADVAMIVLLVLIGLSGASSSAYLGQNQRSLKHRYAQQLQAIKTWVEASRAGGVVARLNDAATPSTALVGDIVAFERLMIVELLDWLAISIDDAMELAPS